MPQILQVALLVVLVIVLIGGCCRIADRVLPPSFPREMAYLGIVVAFLIAGGGGGHYLGWFH